MKKINVKAIYDITLQNNTMFGTFVDFLEQNEYNEILRNQMNGEFNTCYQKDINGEYVDDGKWIVENEIELNDENEIDSISFSYIEKNK